MHETTACPKEFPRHEVYSQLQTPGSNVLIPLTPQAPVHISAHSVVKIVMLGHTEHIADPERGESVSLGESWNGPYPIVH